MKRIGLLGGTFNPIHIGHLAMAQMTMEKLSLDKVVFIPSNIPPHKNIKNLTSARHRYNMVRSAIKGNPRLEISDFEIKQKGRSYTVNTLKHFQSIYPKGTKFFFIIGGDALTGLKRWKSVKELFRLTSFVVVNRPGYLKKSKTAKYYSVPMPGMDLSSSYIRRRVVQGKSIKYLVPDKVIEYIKKNKLFRR